MVDTNAASSFDSTVFHDFLTCFVLVCKPGNKAITLLESMYRKEIVVGSPNHENIFMQKFLITKISRSTVYINCAGGSACKMLC